MGQKEKVQSMLKDLQGSKRWQERLQRFEATITPTQGILSPGMLGKIYVLGYLADICNEWGLEQEIRNEKEYRFFLDISLEEKTPLRSEMVYARRYYGIRDKTFLKQLASFLEDTLYLSKGWRKPATVYLDNLEGKAPLFVPRPAGAPFYFYQKSDKAAPCCSGGCTFQKETPFPDEKNRWTVKLELEVPVVVSTQVNYVNTAPSFPLGKVFGCRERAALAEGDCEGGLRTKGIYKRGTTDLPLITYVTVVYNRRELLQRCMESVWAQSYHNIEYIVIDGGSTDGTLELIKENEDKIDYFVSQPDSGIYNAMNKGISLASGDFLCFMNSDDTCTVNAAKYVVEAYRETHAEIICGWIKLRKTTGEVTDLTHCGRFLIRNNILRYPMLYHQALYPSRKTFETVGYLDEKYKIPADNKWTTEAINTGFPISLIEEIVAIFSLGGNSDEQKTLLLKESGEVQGEFFPEIPLKWIDITYLIMKRAPISNRELFPLFRKLKPYFKNMTFKRLIYECSLYMCTDEFYYTRNTNELSTKWVKKKVQKIDPQIVLQTDKPLVELRGLLMERLEQHLHSTSPDVSNRELVLVGRFKSFHNCCQRIIERRLCWKNTPKGKKCLLWIKMVLRQTICRIQNESVILMAKRVRQQYLGG